MVGAATARGVSGGGVWRARAGVAVCANGGSDAQKKSLGRANAAKFIERLCQYPGSPEVIKEAQEHILKAHAERLTRETGKPVTVEDIVAGRAPRPKVLDMFAGGGAIPLEALRLGCESYALDLNPVAHIIQLCTLVYPQKFGKPDPSVKGSAEDGTWAGLAAEVEHWGNWVLEKVKAEIGDLYPPIPDPAGEWRRNRQRPAGDDGFCRRPAAEAQSEARLSDARGVSLDADSAMQKSGVRRDRAAGETNLALQKERPLRGDACGCAQRRKACAI